MAEHRSSRGRPAGIGDVDRSGSTDLGTAPQAPQADGRPDPALEQPLPTARPPRLYRAAALDRPDLLAKGFECIRQYPDSSTWHHPGCVEHTPTCRSRLLDDDRFSDYAKVTGMLVQDVAAFLCVGELRVLAEIEATEVKEGSDA